VVAWLTYVWPTPWEHFKMREFNIRVNRFTGTTETLSADGWQRHKKDIFDRLAPD